MSAQGENNNKRHQPRLNSTFNNTTTLTMLRMEYVLDKLKRLNYEEYYVKLRRNKPITRHHFVAARTSSNNALQYKEYLTLVSWLLSVIYGGEDQHPTQKFISTASSYEHDPVTCAENIIEALNELRSFNNKNEDVDGQGGVSKEEADDNAELLIGDFTVAKLKQAHGDEVVQSLDFLTSKACDKLFLRFELPNRLLDETNNIQEDNGFCLIVEEGKVNDNVTDFSGNVVYKKGWEKAKDNPTRGVIHSTINPVQWREEVERVAPQVKVAMDSFTSPRSIESEWRAHMLQTNQHQEKMRIMLPWIDTRINYVIQTAAKDVESTRAKNKYLTQQFGSLSEEYSKVSGDSKIIEETYQQSFVKVKNLKENLGKLEDHFSATKREMNEKGKSMSDMTPLLNLKTAMQRIKLEIQNFDVRIGVLNHTLLHLDAMKNEDEGSGSNNTTSLVFAEDGLLI